MRIGDARRRSSTAGTVRWALACVAADLAFVATYFSHWRAYLAAPKDPSTAPEDDLNFAVSGAATGLIYLLRALLILLFVLFVVRRLSAPRLRVRRSGPARWVLAGCGFVIIAAEVLFAAAARERSYPSGSLCALAVTVAVLNAGAVALATWIVARMTIGFGASALRA